MPNPNTIPFLRYQDIQISDASLQKQFKEYCLTGQYSQALSLLNNNTAQLQGKAFIANTINTITAGLLKLENYFYEGVIVYLSDLATQYQLLVNNLRKRGNWLSSFQYTPYNFVVYNNDIYMCFQTPPIGTPPTNESYWLYLGLRGIEGVPGFDVVMKYDWQPTVSYEINDLVVYNGTIYVALEENTGVVPGTDDSVWLVFIQFVRGEIYVGVDAPFVLANNVIWFQTQTDLSQATDTTPVIGKFQRYLFDYSSWDVMYPNTLFNWVEDYSNYAQISFVDTVTIQVSDWVDNKWSYEYKNLMENSAVDILPNGPMSSDQGYIFSNLTTQVEGKIITLTSNVTPNTAITIRIRIIQ